METKDKKILITGGHMTPAYITATHLQSKGYHNLIWVGRKYTQAGDTATSPEFQLVKKLNIPFIHLTTGKLWRKWNKFTYFNAIKDLLLIPWGLIQAYWIIFRYRPDLILSFGGYVSLPVVIAGKTILKKVITHEQVLAPGLANEIIAKLSDRVLISWEVSKQYFPPKKTIFTGNPSWIDFNKDNIITSKIVFPDKLPIITVIGGNQGAHIINTAIFSILPELLQFANIIHQTGRSEITGDKYTASSKKSELSEPFSSRYMFKPFIGEDIYNIYDKSSLIIARGGANTMTDIILKGKKSIIIPIPWSSGQEQLHNGEYLKSLGLSEILQYENEINPEGLLKLIKKLLKRQLNINITSLKKIQTNIRYSPQKIIKVIETILK